MTSDPTGGLGPAAQRRQQAAELRGQGLKIQEIAERLGCSAAAVSKMLGQAGGAPAMVRCRECGQPISPIRRGKRRGVLCLACLADRPEAPLGERLLAFRIAAALTTEELAQRSGLTARVISTTELQRRKLFAWPDVLRLVRVLGPGLVALGLEQLGLEQLGQDG